MTQEKSHWFPTTKPFCPGLRVSNPPWQESSFGALPPLEETAGTTQRLALPSPQTEVWDSGWNGEGGFFGEGFWTEMSGTKKIEKIK